MAAAAVQQGGRYGRARFGPFELDSGARELRRAGRRVALQQLPFALLELLAERAGELVTREEVCLRLWPDDVHVDFEQGVKTALKKLRHALGDCPRRPRYVETVPRRGYRFVMRVSRPAVPDAASLPPAARLLAERLSAFPPADLAALRATLDAWLANDSIRPPGPA